MCDDGLSSIVGRVDLSRRRRRRRGATRKSLLEVVELREVEPNLTSARAGARDPASATFRTPKLKFFVALVAMSDILEVLSSRPPRRLGSYPD